MAKPTLHRELPEMARDYDMTIIDGAPRVNELGRAAILASDTIVIPVQPSSYDVWATAETVQLVREATLYKPDLKSAFAINRKITGTAIGRDVASALQQFGVEVLPTHVSQRVLFAESAAQGLAVAEVAPKSDAAREIAALVDILRPTAQRAAA
jgi:chromosome partitioning protein